MTATISKSTVYGWVVRVGGCDEFQAIEKSCCVRYCEARKYKYVLQM